MNRTRSAQQRRRKSTKPSSAPAASSTSAAAAPNPQSRSNPVATSSRNYMQRSRRRLLRVPEMVNHPISFQPTMDYVEYMISSDSEESTEPEEVEEAVGELEVIAMSMMGCNRGGYLLDGNLLMSLSAGTVQPMDYSYCGAAGPSCGSIYPQQEGFWATYPSAAFQQAQQFHSQQCRLSDQFRRAQSPRTERSTRNDVYTEEEPSSEAEEDGRSEGHGKAQQARKTAAPHKYELKIEELSD